MSFQTVLQEPYESPCYNIWLEPIRMQSRLTQVLRLAQQIVYPKQTFLKGKRKKNVFKTKMKSDNCHTKFRIWLGSNANRW